MTFLSSNIAHRPAVRGAVAALASLALLGASGCGRPAAAEPETTAVATLKAAPRVAANTPFEAGRYLVKIGGCNDCHTPGYNESLGKLPEDEWLTGSPMGFAGPWGVTYPANLRLSFANMTEAEFLELSHKGEGRPPMPWPSLMAMSDDDLKAIYAYVRHLGPKGSAMPAALNPGVKSKDPVIRFEPVKP